MAIKCFRAGVFTLLLGLLGGCTHTAYIQVSTDVPFMVPAVTKTTAVFSKVVCKNSDEEHLSSRVTMLEGYSYRRGGYKKFKAVARDTCTHY